MLRRALFRILSMLRIKLSSDVLFFIFGLWYRYVHNVHIGRQTKISSKVRFKKSYKCKVFIGDYTFVEPNTLITTYDFVNSVTKNIRIGRNCFIGFGVIILPGVNIGDSVVITENTVVDRDLPSNCIVSGNPCYVVERGIITGKWGVRLDNNNIYFFQKK